MSDATPCAHSWRVDYVCALCGAVKHGSPPLWAFELVMKAGPWAVLLALWTFADGGPGSPPVWPGNSKLRKRCRGIAVSTLQGHLNSLAEMGWIRKRETARREFELAWFTPRNFEGSPPENPEGTPRDSGPPENLDPPKTQSETPENPEVTAREPGPTPPKTQTHTYSRPEIDLALTEAVDARPSGKPANGELPSHVTERVARAKREPGPAPGSKLSPEWRLAIRAHDQGWWYSQAEDQVWCDAVSEAAEELRFELPHFLRCLDAWRDETANGVPTSTPTKREIPFTRGPRGRLAREWLRKTIAATRPQLRVVPHRQTLAEARAEMER